MAYIFIFIKQNSKKSAWNGSCDCLLHCTLQWYVITFCSGNNLLF